MYILLMELSTKQAEFGDAVLDMFPQLLIAKAVEDAKKKISLKIEKNKLPSGVSKKLIRIAVTDTVGIYHDKLGILEDFKLYLSKGTIASGGQIAAIKTNIEGAMSKLERIDTDLTAAEKKKAELQNLSRQVSERIVGHKSKADYERQRKILKGQRDLFLRNATDAQVCALCREHERSGFVHGVQIGVLLAWELAE
ncbi:MAG: hypothetical protein SOW29_07530 [Candidatus Faecousia sp.]|nr:hypothetical protein [Candidatus Faecousia sp.]